MRSDASAPNDELGVAADRVGAADVAWSTATRAALGVDAADAGLERRARRPASPTAAAGPTRSARRSTSLVPRGEATGTSQRTVPLQRVERRPGAGPGPTTQRVLEGGEHAGLRAASADRRGAAASTACGRRARRRPAPSGRRRARRRARRPPAARSRRARRAACASFTLPPSSATRSLSRVTTAAMRPSLPTPADSGAPALARQSSRPVSASSATHACRRSPASVSTLPLTATVERELDRADALVPDLAHA